MKCWVHEALKTVIVLVGRGEQFLFQIQLISVLKEFLWWLTALVFPGLTNTWMWKKTKKSCRMDFMTQAKGNLWPSGKVGQLGWGQLSGKCVWIPESEIPDLDPKFDTFIALIHWALTITWQKFCFPIGCTRENYSSPPECLLYFHTEYFISDASGHQMCGSFRRISLFSDTSWLFYNLTQFWQYLPGCSIRSQGLRAQSIETAATSDDNQKYY